MTKIFIKFLFLCSQTLFCEEFVDGIVAKVEGNTIINSDVLQTIQMQAMQIGVDISTRPSFVEENYNQALDFVINQHVIFELAKKDTLIEVSGDEIHSTIESEVDLMVQRAGSKNALEEILGLSIQEYKVEMWNDVEKRLLIERFQQSFMAKIKISRQEVINFFSDYKDSIPVLPPRSTYSVVEIPIEPSKEAEIKTISLLKAIKDSILTFGGFSDFAQKYSQDPGSKNNGGDLGYILRGNLVKEFEESAFSLDIGEISNPIKTDFGYHLIQTINKQGEKIHAKHILIQTKPTNKDKSNTRKLLTNIYHKAKNNVEYFDSLAYKYQIDYQNNSGVFKLVPDNTISSKVFNIIEPYKDVLGLLDPQESGNNSYILIYVKNRVKKEKPSLENSWQELELMAKNNKIANKFEMWINSEKENLFIKRF
ncbi:MAG: hypothetical protein CMF96_10160 [Candidatus Marinimicrobia bacterium]|nr:hypothetical protein [Candidatus Neomarinimicrobiota bacterium]